MSGSTFPSHPSFSCHVVSFRFNNIVPCVRQFQRLFPRIIFEGSRVFPGIIVPCFKSVSKNYISGFARVFPRIIVPGFACLGFFTSVKYKRFMSKSVFKKKNCLLTCVVSCLLPFVSRLRSLSFS